MEPIPACTQKARRHLARRDPVLKQIIQEVGPCSLCTEPDRFALLARSIVSQQISGKAAASIGARLRAAVKKLTAANVLKLSEAKLRECGLSNSKTRAIRDLAAKIVAREVVLDTIHELDDEAVIDHLLPVFGIGRWTAEMFLIFSLGRPNVLPVNDLGLRAGVRARYGLAELPGKAELIEMSEPWQPYCSIATWYFWRSLGSVPQS